MRITSFLRIATLTLALIAATGAAFAATHSPQQTGVYDGADFEAAKLAHN